MLAGEESKSEENKNLPVNNPLMTVLQVNLKLNPDDKGLKNIV